MRAILSEKNIVVILFVMVLITFSLAQEDSRKMEKMYSGVNATAASKFQVHQPVAKIQGDAATRHAANPAE